MTRDALKYYVRQAFKSLKKNKLTTVASISTSVATLLILGAFIALSMNISYMAQQFSRSCQIQVFINEDSTDETYDKIGDSIKKISGVKKIEKYTKQQIFDEQVEKLGEDAKILEGLEDDNPFRDSYKVELSDISKTASVVKAIKKIKGVANVTDFQEAAGYITKFVKAVTNVSLWIVIILCVISSLIVSNAVKVSVFSRRKEINIMKYVGATDWFIRWPFVVEGIIMGIYSAAITFALMFIIYSQIYKNFSFQNFEMLKFSSISWVLLAAFAVVGMVIGSVGSAISIRKHLKV